jgi:AraC family transcriptional regulator
MAVLSEKLLTFRSLFDSPIVSVSDYCCQAFRGGPATEEHSSGNNIVFMRHGAFSKHFGRRSVTADVNQTVFFSRGSTYRISHPADCGDRGVIFTPSAQDLNDIIREIDPFIDDRPEWTFPFVTGPCDSGLYWRFHELIRWLEYADTAPIKTSRIEPLSAEVTALQLIAEALESAFARHGAPLKRRRNSTDADHADRVEAAKQYLSHHLGDRITLDDVAKAAGASPYHLTRIFHQRTGAPVHRYLNRLRLRAALEQLADGADDLTALALELGFSSHSHFTDAFRREFGRAPSEARRIISDRGSRA